MPSQTVPLIRADALRLHSADDVLIAVRPLAAGTRIAAEDIACRDPIPAGHKLAARDLPKGHAVRRYNQVIGFATEDINAGAHIHSHNLAFEAFERDYAIGADVKTPAAPSSSASFKGIRRADGRIATRNYIGVLATVNCSASVSRFVARHFSSEVLAAWPNVDGVLALTHGSGCGMDTGGEGMALMRRTMAGYARHPNFAGMVVIALGCEANQITDLFSTQDLAQSRLLRPLVIQAAGGTRECVAAGIAAVREMLAPANEVERVTVPASHLTVALQCGGSDGYSGITANPALGAACDLLVAQGGTVVLAETPEIYGAEHLLTRRAVSAAVAAKLIDRIRWWEDYTARNRGSMDNNPTPGNKAGGLTTILEKSLGAVAKGGTTNLVEVYEYAEPITAKGLVFMDSPGYDPVSITGEVAGGANLVAFTTGRGSVYGGKPAPSIKIATNTALYQRMRDDMDIDAGGILDGSATVAQKGQEIFELWLRVASGEQSRSEALGIGDEEFVPWQIGAVM